MIGGGGGGVTRSSKRTISERFEESETDGDRKKKTKREARRGESR